MKKYFDTLRGCSLFQQIEDENLLALLACLGARVECFEKKYTIIAEGSPAKYIGILLSGSAQAAFIDYNGNRSIVSGIERSDVFGETFSCAEVPAVPISIIANEPCEVMFIESRRLMRPCSHACGFHQQIIFNLMKDLATKNLMFHQRMEITSQRSTRGKLMTYLLLQAKKNGCSSFEIPFNRQELADFLEVDRSGLSTEISKLRKEGIIKNERRAFELL